LTCEVLTNCSSMKDARSSQVEFQNGKTVNLDLARKRWCNPHVGRYRRLFSLSVFFCFFFCSVSKLADVSHQCDITLERSVSHSSTRLIKSCVYSLPYLKFFLFEISALLMFLCTISTSMKCNFYQAICLTTKVFSL